MSDITEEEWKEAMTKIFDKLDADQYNRMLTSVDLTTPQKKTAKFKSTLPQKVIEKYGLEESIWKINKVMKEIPRNDPGVQNLLRPFVDKLGEFTPSVQVTEKLKDLICVSQLSVFVWRHYSEGTHQI